MSVDVQEKQRKLEAHKVKEVVLVTKEEAFGMVFWTEDDLKEVESMLETVTDQVEDVRGLEYADIGELREALQAAKDAAARLHAVGMTAEAVRMEESVQQLTTQVQERGIATSAEAEPGHNWFGESAEAEAEAEAEDGTELPQAELSAEEEPAAEPEAEAAAEAEAEAGSSSTVWVPRPGVVIMCSLPSCEEVTFRAYLASAMMLIPGLLRAHASAVSWFWSQLVLCRYLGSLILIVMGS